MLAVLSRQAVRLVLVMLAAAGLTSSLQAQYPSSVPGYPPSGYGTPYNQGAYTNGYGMMQPGYNNGANPYGSTNPYGMMQPSYNNGMNPYGSTNPYGMTQPGYNNGMNPYGSTNPYGMMQPGYNNGMNPYGSTNPYGMTQPGYNNRTNPYASTNGYGMPLAYNGGNNPYASMNPMATQPGYNNRTNPYASMNPMATQPGYNNRTNPYASMNPMAMQPGYNNRNNPYASMNPYAMAMQPSYNNRNNPYAMMQPGFSPMPNPYAMMQPGFGPMPMPVAAMSPPTPSLNNILAANPNEWPYGVFTPALSGSSPLVSSSGGGLNPPQLSTTIGPGGGSPSTVPAIPATTTTMAGFSPDSQRYLQLSVSRAPTSNDLQLCNVADGTVVQHFHAAGQPFVFSTDDKQLFTVCQSNAPTLGLGTFGPPATGSNQKVVSWNLADGKQGGSFPARQGDQFLDFSRNGKYAVSQQALDKKGVVSVWDMTHGQVVRDLNAGNPLAPDGEQRIASAAFSPDGNTVLVTFSSNQKNNNVVKLFDLAKRAERSLQETNTNIGGFSADGSLVLIYGEGGLRVWNVATGQQAQTMKDMDQDSFRSDPVSSSGGFQGAVLSADGKFVLTERGNGPLKLWNLSTGECLRRIQVSGLTRTPLYFSPDGKFAADPLNLYDLNASRIFRSFGTVGLSPPAQPRGPGGL